MTDSEKRNTTFTIHDIPEPEHIGDVVYALMVNPNLSTVSYFNDFSTEPITPDSVGSAEGEEAGIFELPGAATCVSMTTHAFHHHLAENPQGATEILISRAARKMLCLGAEPLAVSAFLYHINIMDLHGHQIASGAKKGLEHAARKFNLRITDRKIRFDHFKDHDPVPPTIIISMLGMMGKSQRATTHAFKEKGNNIFLIGRCSEDVGASEYVEFYHGITHSPLPACNIDEEVVIQEALRRLHKQDLISSASPVGKGGLFFTLLRACFPNNLGFDITTDAEIRKDAFLFGETMGRILVDVDPDREDTFVDLLSEMKVPFFMLGHVTRGEIRVDDVSMGFIDKMSNLT